MTFSRFNHNDPTASFASVLARVINLVCRKFKNDIFFKNLVGIFDVFLRKSGCLFLVPLLACASSHAGYVLVLVLSRFSVILEVAGIYVYDIYIYIYICICT